MSRTPWILRDSGMPKSVAGLLTPKIVIVNTIKTWKWTNDDTENQEIVFKWATFKTLAPLNSVGPLEFLSLRYPCLTPSKNEAHQKLAWSFSWTWNPFTRPLVKCKVGYSLTCHTKTHIIFPGLQKMYFTHHSDAIWPLTTMLWIKSCFSVV